MLLVFGSATSASATVRVSVTPHRQLVNGQTVTVAWVQIPRIRKGDDWVDECLPNWQALGVQAACDFSGVALREQTQVRTGSLQTQVIQGALVNARNQTIGTCGTTPADNNCVILVRALNRATGEAPYQLPVAIRFTLPN